MENVDLLFVADNESSRMKSGCIYYKRGLLHDLSGNLRPSTEYYEKCIRIFKEHPDQ